MAAPTAGQTDAVDLLTLIIGVIWTLLWFLKPLTMSDLDLVSLMTSLVLWVVGMVFLVFITPLVYGLAKKVKALVG